LELAKPPPGRPDAVLSKRWTAAIAKGALSGESRERLPLAISKPIIGNFQRVNQKVGNFQRPVQKPISTECNS
jgi:hypothetical protein